MQYAVPRAKVFLIFPSSQQQRGNYAALMPRYLPEERRRELVMVLQLPPFLDSFRYYFSTRIVLQFECGERLLLNEYHEAF